MAEHKVFAQNGKYGLLDGKQVVLEGVYSSIQIIAEDPALEDLLSAEAFRELDNAWASTITKMDFAILNADGKVGLVSEGRILLEFKYERIIKLSYSHYLCQEGERYTLYDIFYYDYKLRPKLLATIHIPGGITLEKVLSVLAREHPEVHEMLSIRLRKDPVKGIYISEYQIWEGRVGFHCIFPTVASQKVRMDDDFGVTPLKVDLTF
jgi:hypothetical protein